MNTTKTGLTTYFDHPQTVNATGDAYPDFLLEAVECGNLWETGEAGEDRVKATAQTGTLISKYRNKMRGVFGMTSTAFPGAAEAVVQARLCPFDAANAVKAPTPDDAISVVGLSAPNSMKPYVTGKDKGWVKSVVVWNPVDLGYARTAKESPPMIKTRTIPSRFP